MMRGVLNQSCALIHAEMVMVCTGFREAALETVTWVDSPSNDNAPLIMPLVHPPGGLPRITAPVLVFPEESLAMVPVPSSNVQYASKLVALVAGSVIAQEDAESAEVPPRLLVAAAV